MNNPYHRQYAQVQTGTTSPDRLLLLMYEGANKFLGQAEVALREGRLGPGKTALSRGLAIVAELQNSLDHDAGWSASHDLSRLYGYMILELTQANVSGEIERITQVRALLAGLYETWREAIDSNSQTVARPVAAATPSSMGEESASTLRTRA